MVRVSGAKSTRYQLRHDGREVEIVAAGFLVGRDTDCDCILKNALVSRHHARFREDPEGLVVEDLRSMNGVFVNQRRIREPTVLAHGDVVGIGLDTFEVMDTHVVPRAKRATMPQPFAQSDVEGPEAVTLRTSIEVLTPREREVFELIVLGHTQREIAIRLHVSVKTVETHRTHIAEKLHCRTRAELVAYAMSAGILRRGA